MNNSDLSLRGVTPANAGAQLFPGFRFAADSSLDEGRKAVIRGNQFTALAAM
jgi:hypothetical protein